MTDKTKWFSSLNTVEQKVGTRVASIIRIDKIDGHTDLTHRSAKAAELAQTLNAAEEVGLITGSPKSPEWQREACKGNLLGARNLLALEHKELGLGQIISMVEEFASTTRACISAKELCELRTTAACVRQDTPVIYIDSEGNLQSRVSIEQVLAVLGPIVDELRKE